MSLSPLNHRVLLKPDGLEKVTKGGIVIPDTVAETDRSKTQSGTVVAFGPSCDEAFIKGVKVGDRVAIPKYTSKVVHDPETKEAYLVINDEDLVCLVEGEEVEDNE